MINDIYRIPEQVCPYCARPIDASGTAEGSEMGNPRPGDATLCLRCGGLAIYTSDLSMRVPMMSELLEMKTNPGWAVIEKARHNIEAIRARKP
jgi:hypothetical protein